MGTQPVVQKAQPPHFGASTRENDLFAKAIPHLGTDEASHLTRAAFGVDGAATLLTGERDQNFLVQDSNGNKYVLKVTHPSEEPGVTDFQTKAQLHVLRQSPEVSVPKIYPAISGEYIHRRPVPETGETQAVRLISFVDGVPLFKTNTSSKQRAAVGAALAKFDVAIADFTHPQMHHKLLWDLQYVGELRDLLAFVDDGQRQDLARTTLDRILMTNTLTSLRTGRRQVIHNDLNGYNVMVSSVDPADVTGLLDFGDMVQAPLAQDLAVACAYQLSESANPLDTALDCIAGYHAINPLSRDELSAIPDLVAARLLTTVLITEWRAKEHPANSKYILRNNPRSWDGLRRLAEQPLSRQRDFLIDNVL